MKIKELFLDERPRERLLRNGVECLSNVELLAILLRTGTREKNVLELARVLLEDTDGKIGGIASMSIGELMQLDGLGPAKAASLAASFELGKRYSLESSGKKKKPISSPADVYKIMIPHMKSLDHEECWVLLLISANIVLSSIRISTGTVRTCPIDAARISKAAIIAGATGVILAHNHPSGSPSPSAADIKETTKLKSALDTFSSSLVDHIIFAEGRYYSFADEKESALG